MSDRCVVVLSGGLSHERDVSLRSGRRLAAALRTAGSTVEEWDADSALLNRLRDQRPDAVVVALHGGEGENGSVQTIMELLGIPFVGADSHGCRRAWDKPIAKSTLAEHGFSTPDWAVLPHSTFRELGAQAVLDALVAKLGLPLMLKPAHGGSALGAHVVHEMAALPAAMVGCFAYGQNVLVERYISGVEVAATVVEGAGGPQALPAVEIVPQNGTYDYSARYTAGLTTFHAPARLPAGDAAAVAELALAAHRHLGLRDMSRTDAIVDANGVVQFLEVNVSPGLTETSLLPMAVEASGQSLGDVYATLAEHAVIRS